MTRPGISYSIQILSQFMHAPRESHMNSSTCITCTYSLVHIESSHFRTWYFSQLGVSLCLIWVRTRGTYTCTQYSRNSLNMVPQILCVKGEGLAKGSKWPYNAWHFALCMWCFKRGLNRPIPSKKTLSIVTI